MRIKCPYCGERDASEFTYLGAADLKRPDPAAPNAEAAFFEYAYIRDNPAGPMAELWYHGGGCRSWLRVVRDTRNHEIESVALAKPEGRTAVTARDVAEREPFRLASGGVIDRTRSLNFTFDGRSYAGYPGDTLASALLANGERLVGRSFKYHRPRGIFSAGAEEPNALIEVRTGARREPNTRATMIELYDGLDAASQNRWPSLKFDVQSINGLMSPFFSAGFYYKTFMWPAKFWKLLYEPIIRRSAGLGRAAAEPDPDHYEKAFVHCDVLVIGGGPAGLMAALTAGRAGARVILAEEDFMFGGRLLSERLLLDGKPARDWLRAVVTELQRPR